MKSLSLMGKRLVIYPGVYEHSEDSYILIDASISRASGDVLDLCCGTGIVGLSVAEKADSVTGVDVSVQAVKNTFENFKMNGAYEKLDAVVGDPFRPLKKKEYDLIVMNPPYLWDVAGEPEDLS
ncbi:MAG: methyltransferase [Candidatus Methanomethylicaceae archaeon]